jgi:predicted N-acetyltransferase YhbS
VKYTFREAAPEDFDAIRRLNHRTFAEELGQHAVQPGGLLEDRFESRARYFLALLNGDVIGMICAMHDRPFSVESRLADLSVLDAWPEPRVEIRLLAIEPEHRNGLVMAGLIGRLMKDVSAAGVRTMLISGVSTRLSMYGRMGFVALGPPVESGRASYVPMAARIDRLPDAARRGLDRAQRASS